MFNLSCLKLHPLCVSHEYKLAVFALYLVIKSVKVNADTEFCQARLRSF
jgi:hypothetical protein